MSACSVLLTVLTFQKTVLPVGLLPGLHNPYTSFLPFGLKAKDDECSVIPFH